MTFPTLKVIDGANTLQTINTLPPAGQQNLAGSLPVGLASDQVVAQKDSQLIPLGVASFTVNSTAQSLQALANVSANVVASARLVYIQPENSDLKWRDDGVSPNTSIGARIYATVDYPIISNTAAIQLISATGITVNTNVRFYQ